MLRRIRTALLAAIGVLYVVSLPWYRDPEAPVETVYGFPDWVAVAIACYVGVAVLNAAAWLLTEIRDPGTEDGDAE